MNVYSFSFSIFIFFLNPERSKLLKEISPTKFVFFIGLRTAKPTRTRTLNRIPIWHGLIHLLFPMYYNYIEDYALF